MAPLHRRAVLGRWCVVRIPLFDKPARVHAFRQRVKVEPCQLSCYTYRWWAQDAAGSMQVHARGGHKREWRHLVAIFVSRAMASFHPHSLFQALLVLEPARTNRRTTSPACRRAQVGPSDSVRNGISKKYHAVNARGGSLLRFVRSAQHRVIDLGSTRHEQNRSRSPCSVFSSTRPPWPSDFLNCWPPLAGRESPKPCKDQGDPGRGVQMRE